MDGSFLEDVEKVRGRPPADLDVVSWVRIGVARTKPDPALVSMLTDHSKTKARFHIDHFIHRLDAPGEALVGSSRYWFGLFSHQRDTAVWKGMLQLDLDPSAGDVAARDFLNRLVTP